jgi:hypothetical protein
VTDRTQIYRILSEVGLNPNNYTFSPLPEDSPVRGPTPSHTSAFSSYPPQQGHENQQPTKPQSQSLFTSGRPLTYVQQPAPPPPPPPQPPTSQPPPSDRNQAPPTSQAPVNQQQGPPSTQTTNNRQQGSPPSQSQQGASVLSALFNRPAPNTQNTTSQSPQDMSRQMFSPRRTPPPPPCNFYSDNHNSSLSAEHYLRQVNSHENPPVKVVKQSTQNVVYRKEIRIRYLQPPTPPPPAPIIIREKHLPPHPAQSVRINLFISIFF